MPIPKRQKGEDKEDFIQRCMSNSSMVEEYKDSAQRYAICQSQAKPNSMAEHINDSVIESGGTVDYVFAIHQPSRYIDLGDEEEDFIFASGEKVKLNKPFRTPSGPKKFSVYVKNDKGNVVKVNFGDPNMEIKRDDPERRKNFRARHGCDNPGPKWKPKYWSCKMWSNKKVKDV